MFMYVAFILGSLPLSLSTTLSPTRFHQLSIFSVGLLIGAALTIVIPEGIDTIYSSSDLRANHTDASQPIVSHDPQLRHHHTTIGLALMGGFMLM
jgi:zinc transporter 9